MNKKSLEIPKG